MKTKVKKSVILAGNPVPADWEFQKGIEETTGQPWEVRRWCINEYTGIKKYTRYLKYIFYPMYLAVVRDRYERILSWEQFFGLVLAYYLRIFHCRKCPPIDIMTFIYRPKKGIIGKIYFHFVRSAVTSPYIRRIYVFGRSEIENYRKLFGVPKEKFAAEVLGIADVSERIGKAEPAGKGIFYLAAGRSNRDYDFLRDAWSGHGESLCIISDRESARDTQTIHYEKDCHGDDYLRLLAQARAVIIPLRAGDFSSGQLVVLQAAMLGKPVIVTENDTIRDYIEDGITGFIIPKRKEALWDALQQLEDEKRYEQICRNAREKFVKDFSLYELGCRVGQQVRSV